MKSFFFVIILSFTFFGFRNAIDDPEIIARNYLHNLIYMDSATYVNKYKIEASDVDWFTQKVSSFALMNQDMKDELFSFINTSTAPGMNARLKNKYHEKWSANIQKYKINIKKIEFVESIFILSNQKLRPIIGLGLSIKFKNDNQYFIIEVDPLIQLNNNWKHGGITNFYPCDQTASGR